MDAQDYFNRAEAHLKFKNYQDAINDYTSCININPNHDIVYFRRAVAYADSSRYQEAIKDYDKAIDLYNKGLFSNAGLINYLYLFRAMCNERLANCKEAIIDYTNLIKIEKNYASNYVLRAGLYQELGDNENALADYNTAIKINPVHNSYVARGDFYLRIGKKDQALSDYKNAVTQITIKDDIDYITRASIYQKMELYEQALSDCNSAIKLKPSSPSHHFEKANCYFKMQDFESAILEYSISIKLAIENKDCENENYINSYLNRAKSYEKIGKTSDAIKDYAFVSKINIDEGENFKYVLRGCAFEMLQEYKKAQDDYIYALKIDALNKDAREGILRAKSHQK